MSAAAISTATRDLQRVVSLLDRARGEYPEIGRELAIAITHAETGALWAARALDLILAGTRHGQVPS